jgi:hypothetical protein
MGLFEYLFERKNPGNVGNIETNRQPVKKIGIPFLIIKLLISIFIVSGLFYLIVVINFSFSKLIIFIIAFLVYCTISYNYIPRPDTSNMGLLGGLIDHPFRYTDDINRNLVVLSVLMYPGRFITTTIIQTVMLFRK